MKPLNLVHLIGSMDLGGAEKLTRLTIEGLDREEFKSSVCCLKSGGYYAEQLRTKGYKVDVLLDMHKHANNSIWIGVKTIWRLCLYLRRNRPDILHTHLFVTSCLGRLVGWVVGVKWVVVTIHRIEYPRIQRWIEWLLSPLTDLYITDSHAAARMLSSRLKIPIGKIRVIFNGIDCSEFQPRPSKWTSKKELNIDSDCIVFGIIAHLYQEKGHAFLFESLALAKTKLPKFQVLVVGDGYMLEELKRLTAELGLSKEIVFLGQRSDLARLLSAMDIFVLPSSWEGFGIILAEAMYMGVPVITTRDGGGCAEVVGEMDGGLLVNFGNISELAEALTKLACDPILRQELGFKGEDRVERMFTSPVMVDLYAALYLELAKGVD